MKHKSIELDVDFIGGARPLTKEDEIAISNFIHAEKEKRASGKHSKMKRRIGGSIRKAAV
jgi:triosephosphate isomerase